MDISYRKLRASDIETYHEIRLQCLKDHPDAFGSTYEEEIKKEKFKFDDYISRNDEQNFLLGAFSREHCLGICGFIREEGNRRDHRGHLVQIYVRSTFQGRGIGGELISRSMDEAFDRLKVEQILLGVITDNEQAIGLYEKLGFEGYGVIKNYLKLSDKYLDKRLMIKYKHQDWNNR